MSRLLILGFLLLAPFSSQAQEDFLVIFSSGRNYKHDASGFSELKGGTQLSAEDKIELLPNSTAVLMDSAGRLLKLTLDGKYDMATINLSGLSAPSELMHREWTQFYRTIELRSEPELNGFLFPKTYVPFQFDFPVSTEVYGRYIMLKWPEKKGPYAIEISDEYESVFKQFKTDSTYFSLDILGEDLAFKDAFGVQVIDQNSNARSGVFFLDKMSPPEKEILDQLLRSFPENESSIFELTKAVIFENRGLFADAASLLRKLAQENPALYKTFYEAYLKRNGFEALIDSTDK